MPKCKKKTILQSFSSFFLRSPCIFFISTLIMWPFVSPMTTPAATSTIGRRLLTCSATLCCRCRDAAWLCPGERMTTGSAVKPYRNTLYTQIKTIVTSVTHEVPTFAPEFEPGETIVGLGGFIIKKSEPTTTFIIYRDSHHYHLTAPDCRSDAVSCFGSHQYFTGM